MPDLFPTTPTTPSVPTPSIPTVSVTDNLCYQPGATATSSYFDVQAEIDGLNGTISALRASIDTVRGCEATALEAWKLQYPFSCPATKPNFENYQSFLPTASLLALPGEAADKTSRAAALELEATGYEVRAAAIPAAQAIQTTAKLAAQVSLDKFTKFKAYWNANGANYDAVFAKYTADALAATQAVTDATAAFNL